MEELSSSSLKQFWARRVFRSSSAIICQSQMWKDFFKQFVSDDEKLNVIENWIDIHTYDFGEKQKREVPTLLFMSWLIKEKGIYELIDAIAELNDEGHAFNVVICGGGSASDEVQKMARDKSLHNISFQGWVTGHKKLELFKKSDIYVLPSYTEGFSNSLLEAMASGLAVITTPVGASVDIIEDKNNGLLVDVKSVTGLKNAIKYYLENPDMRESIGQNAKACVTRRNSVEVAVTQVSDLIENL